MALAFHTQHTNNLSHSMAYNNLAVHFYTHLYTIQDMLIQIDISWQRSETCQLGFVRDITVAPSLYLATHVTHHIQS